MKEPWYKRLKRWWFGACETHGYIYESHLFKHCPDCWKEWKIESAHKEREEKIEIIKEGVIRAHLQLKAEPTQHGSEE